MKRITLTFILAVFAVVCIFPATALAADTSPTNGYNDHDEAILRAFLELDPDGIKNGVRINSAYDVNDPTTWGVSWVEQSGEKYAEYILWDNRSLSGALDVSSCVYLNTLDVRENTLTSLNVLGCTNLNMLLCNSNSLTSLDLSGNTLLRRLECNTNELTSLDTSAAGVNLKYLYCASNFLTALNASANTALISLGCYNNAITALNLSNKTALAFLDCENNELSSLDLSDCTALNGLFCSKNPLGALDVTSNTLLDYLYCDETGLTALDVSNCLNLDTLVCRKNDLTTLNVASNLILEQLDCSENHLSALDVSGDPKLTYLNFVMNSVEAIDLTNNTKLEFLYCAMNPLSTLDASMCPDLKYFSSSYGYLTQIDVIAAGAPVSVTAGPGGYVGLDFDSFDQTMRAFSHPFPTSGPLSWTDDTSNTEFSTLPNVTLTLGTSYDLTANFLTLTPSVETSVLYVGGRITLTPSAPGGTWEFDGAYLSQNGNEFTALKKTPLEPLGILYHLNGTYTYYTLEIKATGLAQTGQDFTPVWLLLALGAAAFTALAALCLRRKPGRLS